MEQVRSRYGVGMEQERIGQKNDLFPKRTAWAEGEVPSGKGYNSSKA